MELPVYPRPPQPSRPDLFKGRMADLLAEHPRLWAVRFRDLLSNDEYSGGLTMLRDHMHQIPPRSVYAFVMVLGYGRMLAVVFPPAPGWQAC